MKQLRPLKPEDTAATFRHDQRRSSGCCLGQYLREIPFSSNFETKVTSVS